MASECEGMKGHKLKMYGFGIKQGFYSIEIPEAAKQNSENVGCIKILEGEADEKKVGEELKNLIDKNWNWQVRNMSKDEYVVVFPNKQTLVTFSKLSELCTTIYQLKIKVTKSDIDPEATGKLHMVWMKIYGIPSFAKIESVIKEISSLAAEPVVVDELSLIRTGPVRVKVKCRDPAQLRGFVEIFFNSVGYEIRFVVEGFKNSAKGEGPSDGGGHDHDKKDDRGDDDSEDSDDDGYDEDDTKTEWEKFQEREKLKEKEVQRQKDESESADQMEDARPIASFNPEDNTLRIFEKNKSMEAIKVNISMVADNDIRWDKSLQAKVKGHCEGESKVCAVDFEGKEIMLLQEKEQVMLKDMEVRNETELIQSGNSVIPQDYFVVHSSEGPHLVKKCKWPNLQEPTQAIANPGGQTSQDGSIKKKNEF